MVAFILPANSVTGGYEIDNSLRFNDDDDPHLARTPSSSGSRTKATVSFWVKRGNVPSSSSMYILEASSSVSPFNMTRVRFGDNVLIIDNTLNGGADNGFYFQSSRFFRDPSAWYHIFFSLDVTQANAGAGWRLYVNGVQQTKAPTHFVQDANLEISQEDVEMNIGRRHDNGDEHFDGYLAEYHYIDGTIKAYTDFGEFNDNGVWIPKEYGGGSYGTNGFYLEYKQTGTSQNSSGIGADTSGNDNHFAVTELNSRDVVVDTPTNNFCTMNPLSTNSRGVFREGNCQVITNVQGSAPFGQVEFGTFFVNTGKWYFEAQVSTVGSGGQMGIGFNERVEDGAYINGSNNLGSAGNVAYTSGGKLFIGSTSETSTGVATFTDDDTVSIAFDLDNNKVYVYKNGALQDGKDPANNDGRAIVSAYNNYWTPWVTKDDTNNNTTVKFNFGNPPQAISSGNSDADGHGNFEYAVPSGYFALCTKNLAEYG